MVFTQDVDRHASRVSVSALPATRSSRSSYRVAFAVTLCVAAAITPDRSAAQQRRAMADSLTDREFWQFFTTISEESGTFPSENFVSNEKTYQHVIPTLQRTLTPNGVYLGVGPEQNFTYIVNLKPRLAVIFDIRRQNAMAHLMYKALFELSPSRAEFVSRLFSRPLPSSLATSAMPSGIFAAAATAPASDSAFDANWKAIVNRLTVTHGFAMSDADVSSMRHVFEAFFEAGPNISYSYRLGRPPDATPWLVTYAELQSLTNADGANMAFLATEENYRWLRALQGRNMIVPVVGDFAGPKAIRGVGEYLERHGATVTAFYVSNVEQYLFNGLGADERFYRNVETLPLDSTSTFIRSLPASSGVAPSPTSLPTSLGATRYTRFDVTDSSGVRIITATGTDSAGQPVQRRFVTGIPPVVPNTGAFASGIAPINRALVAFANGQLKNYGQVIALTKTDGWKPLAPQ